MRTILLSTITFASLCLPGIHSLNASSCGCGGGTTSSTTGSLPAGMGIIYTHATTNIGTSPSAGVALVAEERLTTHANEKPQGGLGLTALLTDPVTSDRPSTARTRNYWVKGGSGSPLQFGHIDADLEVEASSGDVLHPLEISYASGGGAYTTDHREHILVSPPAGHYMLKNLLARDSESDGWDDDSNPTTSKVISDPVSGGATFFRIVFKSERGDAHHQPGEFTFPSLELEENMTTATSELGAPVTGFSFYLGNDMAAGDRQGRGWGRLTARPGLLADVGAHQIRFVTAHSKVDDGGSPLINEIIDASSRIYQIKTADALLDVREVVTSDRGTSSNYSDDLRKVTIRLTTAADAGTPENGIYPQPSTPKYGTVQFEQTERNSNDFVFKTTFRQYAPGANPSSASPIATYVYSSEDIVAGTQNQLIINRDSVETEVIENWLITASQATTFFSTSAPVRMETRHTHIGGTASGNLLDTSRSMREVTSRGEQLFRAEQGSANGSALPFDGWSSTQCLEWNKYNYDGDTGRVKETENRRGEWTQQYFRQDASFYDGTLLSTGLVMLPPETQSPSYDDDGNMTFDGTWTYTWDGENRLLSAELVTLPQGTGAPTVYRRIEFSYDGLSRRIQKKVLERPNSMSSWSQVKAYRYGYEGWNCTIRSSYNGSAWVGDQYYVWGLDLSGTWQGAGGVGGLLATYIEGAGRRFIGYDGNGNVTSLMYPNDGVLHALYEYDAFGNPTRHTSMWGTLAEDNPWRFSTKPTDDETTLIYYGYRYFLPGLGRWISRDPAKELGGMNLMAFCFNNGLIYIDPDGNAAQWAAAFFLGPWGWAAAGVGVVVWWWVKSPAGEAVRDALGEALRPRPYPRIGDTPQEQPQPRRPPYPPDWPVDLDYPPRPPEQCTYIWILKSDSDRHSEVRNHINGHRYECLICTPKPDARCRIFDIAKPGPPPMSTRPSEVGEVKTQHGWLDTYRRVA